MRTSSIARLLIVVAAVALAGCAKKPPPVVVNPPDYEKPLPPGQLALRQITDPSEIPDFTTACGDTAGLLGAISNSLDYLSKPSSQKAFPYGAITHAQAVASLETMRKLLLSPLTPAQMNEKVRESFDVYISVGCDDRGTVLFTGYYTPIFDASPAADGRFRYPIYKPPANLVKLPDGSPASAMPVRQTLEMGNLLAGNELYWLSDPFEVYVAHVQGSAKLRMPDGKLVTVGYAANNGHEYKSIRQELVNDGKIGPRDGLAAMIRYFKSNPQEVNRYTWRNPRFVFFQTMADGQPRGCINEPVTQRRTIATDKKIFPPACLTMTATTLGRVWDGSVQDMQYSAFACDQDAGGAIRAAGRCDIYMGVGPEAEAVAGRTQNEGKLYYLFLKPALMPPPAVPAMLPPAAGTGRSSSTGRTVSH